MRLPTKHLELVLQSPIEVRAMIEAMEPSDKAQLSADWVARAQAATVADPWVHGFAVLHRDTGEFVGNGAFKGPPVEGVVEIAYGIAPDHQNKGFATEVAQALAAYAFSLTEISIVRAHTLPESNASTRVLAKCGFAHVGEVVDPEDGLVWRFERRRSSQ